LSGNPARDRFASGCCFARYVVIEDPTQRRTALAALQRWMAESAQAVSGLAQAISDDNCAAPDALVPGAEQSSAGFLSGQGLDKAGFVSGHDFSRAANAAISSAALAAASVDPADASEQPESSNKQAQIGPPLPIPSGF
jgi:hypothetical protein